MKILIADDSEFMREVLREIINKNFSDPQIFEAATEREAIDQFIKEKPDLTLLDIIMPEKEEGIEALKQIKKFDPDARVVMISAVGAHITIDKCKKLGVADYIIKPFDDVEVVKVLRQYLS